MQYFGGGLSTFQSNSHHNELTVFLPVFSAPAEMFPYSCVKSHCLAQCLAHEKCSTDVLQIDEPSKEASNYLSIK